MCLLYYAITPGRDCKLRHKRQENILFEMKLCKRRRPEGSFIRDLIECEEKSYSCSIALRFTQLTFGGTMR